MSVKRGTYVTIATGEVWDGAEDISNGAVMRVTRLTQAGEIPKNRHADGWLPYWSRRFKSVANGVDSYYEVVTSSSVARYDAETENTAGDIREEIEGLKESLKLAQEALAHLYDYQAGPMPEQEKQQ